VARGLIRDLMANLAAWARLHRKGSSFKLSLRASEAISRPVYAAGGDCSSPQ
jgi:hypothetical protein